MRWSLVVLVAALLATSVASASRTPTASERAAIEFAVRYFPTIGRQNTVRFSLVRVSTADPRYAAAGFTVKDAHGRLLDTLSAVLERTNGWQVIDLGKGPLGCTKAPPEVRFEFGAATCRRRPKP